MTSMEMETHVAEGTMSKSGRTCQRKRLCEWSVSGGMKGRRNSWLE